MGTTNNKPPGSIIMMCQSETLTSSQIVFNTLFSLGAHWCCAFYQRQQTKQLCLAKSAVFHFSSSNFTVQDHILSPAGDALSHHQPFCSRRNFAKKRISNFKIRKSSAFGVFQSPEVSQKIVKISRFLYLVFNV